ncbi:MAG: hypothetical protein KAU36_03995, partial [candidate division Zixibacteria bacterium]|nr:hypothetical protein [candidate division Zixibacteria bacterium]
MPNEKSTTSTPAKVSRRKTTGARKTKKTKTKITKTDATKTVATVAVKQETKREKVLTARHRRVAEKAQVRKTLPAVADVVEVESMKITDVSGVVYEASEYQAMVDMYDATIKAIKEGEIVAGTVMGVSRDDVIVDVGFKSEGVIPVYEFPAP